MEIKSIRNYDIYESMDFCMDLFLLCWSSLVPFRGTDYLIGITFGRLNDEVSITCLVIGF